LPSTGKVFILILLIKIFIIVFFLVEKEILVLICKATLGRRAVMSQVETMALIVGLTSSALWIL
jgi:hypothetical protein